MFEVETEETWENVEDSIHIRYPDVKKYILLSCLFRVTIWVDC